MNVADIPGKIQLPFAAGAGGGFIRPIPVASQIGITDGAASYTDGFVPLNATPIGAGGKPPSIKDMNGVLFAISGWSRWVAAGGPVFFDGTFATAIGGYPKGAVVQSAATPGVFFVSTADANTTDPESVGAANWSRAVPQKATDAEALAATIDTKFVTPANLAALRSTAPELLAGTEARKFISPNILGNLRANAAELLAGTDDRKYATAAALAALNSPGIISLPGGVIIQYGTYMATLTEGTYTRSLNTPMPNSVDTVLVSPINADGGTGTNRDVFTQWKPTPGVKTSFQYVVQQVDSGSSIGGVSWVAFGQ